MTRPTLFLALCLLFAAAHAGAQAVTAPIVEIRIHGNHSTPDADVLALGLPVTGRNTEAGVAQALRRYVL